MSNMFDGCSSLVCPDISGFDMSNVVSAEDMTKGCRNETGSSAPANGARMHNFGSKEVSVFGNSKYAKFEICSVIFEPKAIQGWDVSEKGDGSVLAWVDLTNAGKTLHIGAAAGGKVVLPADSSGMFSLYCKLTSVTFGKNVDTSNVTDMSNMFDGCLNLTSLDLSSFDTANVTDMWGMFICCKGLESLNLSSFDTGKVTNMGGMFYDCSSLVSLDLSSFNTGNVIDMSEMFKGCSSLACLDISGFDMRNVTSAEDMTEGCKMVIEPSESKSSAASAKPSLNRSVAVAPMPAAPANGAKMRSFDSLDGSVFGNSEYDKDSICSVVFEPKATQGWDVSEKGDGSVLAWVDLTDAGQTLHIGAAAGGRVVLPAVSRDMFYFYHNLTSVTFGGNVDTGNVVNMMGMFLGCDSLKSLDLSGFDTRKVMYMNGMFSYCKSLTGLDLSGFDTGNVTEMSAMFDGCSGLASLNVSGFDTRNVTDMFRMFSNCSSLTSLNVSGFNTGRVKNMGHMFENCSSLASLDISGFDLGNVRIFEDMVAGCKNIIR